VRLLCDTSERKKWSKNSKEWGILGRRGGERGIEREREGERGGEEFVCTNPWGQQPALRRGSVLCMHTARPGSWR
jgi:hypothetical protein